MACERPVKALVALQEMNQDLSGDEKKASQRGLTVREGGKIQRKQGTRGEARGGKVSSDEIRLAATGEGEPQGVKRASRVRSENGLGIGEPEIMCWRADDGRFSSGGRWPCRGLGLDVLRLWQQRAGHSRGSDRDGVMVW